MQSLRVLFSDQHQVEVRTESVREPGPGEVLIQASKTLISTGTESIALARQFEPGSHWEQWVNYPVYPGYSLVGQVISIGNDVQGVCDGDRVGVRASHCQYVVTTPDRLYPVPDGVTDEDATWFSIANIVQNGVRRAEHVLGEAVAVIGLGLLGQLVVQYVRLLGAREVIAIDPAQRRLDLARAHGATVALAMDAQQAREDVLRLTDGAGADVVYDVTGAAPVFPAALRLLRRFGRLLLLGDTGSPSAQRLTPDVVLNGLRIIGAHDTNQPFTETEHIYWSHPNMARLFFTYLQRGDMRVADLISHRYAPTDAPEAYRMLREARAAAMGVIFDWTLL